MSQPAKRNGKDAVTVNEIYETIKSRSFLQNLYEDLICDIKEKPTYKFLKDSVTKLIDDSVSELSSLPDTAAQQKKRKDGLQNISILAFTVDKIIFDTLYKKLENDFRSIIGGMVKDIQKEKQEGEQSASNSENMMLENIEEMMENNSAEKIDSNSEIDETSSFSLGFRPAKLGRPSRNSKYPRSVLRNNKPAQPTVTFEDEPEFAESVPRVKRIKQAKSIEYGDDESVSDVSSVHTSELSSFEDYISLDSDEENEDRKIVPLSLANQMYAHGKLSEIFSMQKKATETAKVFPSEEVRSKFKLVPRPIRKRRPNSKYTSSSGAKLIKKQEAEQEISVSPKPAMVARRQNSPRSPKVTPAKRGRKAAVSSSQRYSASDLYKPRPVFGSHAL